MIYCFDLDGTLCTSVTTGDYMDAQPLSKAIDYVNDLYSQGHKIILFTGRGSSSGIDWTEKTKAQVYSWGIKHHELILNRKPTYDVVIDDKAINALEWRKINCGVKGVLAGAFDLIHPGYCRMFAECKQKCDHLTVLLHEDPSLERGKKKPVHTIEERKEILLSMKNIDDVITYKSELELENLLSSTFYDIRFLGDDYRNSTYTGKHLPIKIEFISRSHGYSTTRLKTIITYSYYDNI